MKYVKSFALLIVLIITSANLAQDQKILVFDPNGVSSSFQSTLSQLTEDSTFIAGASGHALEITETGTYAVSGLTFQGYQGTPGSNGTPASGDPEAAVYNNSGGAVVFNDTEGEAQLTAFEIAG